MPYCERCGSETPRGVLYCPGCGAPVGSRPVHYRAEWGERLIAYAIDFIVVSVALGAVSLASRINPGLLPLPWTRYIYRWGAFGFLSLRSLAFFGYWIFMEYMYGQSIGKTTMRIRVADMGGGQLSLGQAAVESFGKAFLLPLDLVAGLALYPWKWLRLSSHLSGAVVVRDSPECCPVEPIRV
jgi:uncharacterized RDD family membrane protein YckC